MDSKAKGSSIILVSQNRYWYPYFTTMNIKVDKKDINLNFIIPAFIFDTINEIGDSLPEIENFQEKLASFDNTQKTAGVVLNSEVSHDQIKDYIAENSDTLEDGLRLISKEYRTGEVGDIDILAYQGYINIESERHTVMQNKY